MTLTKMVNISAKKDVRRVAIAKGEIVLKESTIEAIRNGKIEKGDALRTAEVAGILALKRTHEIVPLCHPIQITSAEIEFFFHKGKISAECKVEALYKTGVEMEALVGVTTALLTIWDMVKYLEKDRSGNYPATRVREIEVMKKRKR
ncbi:MAG: cyclic pyranopterin monophosphate synthase MoaC [Thermoproteota archaeon]